MSPSSLSTTPSFLSNHLYPDFNHTFITIPRFALMSTIA